MNFSLLYFSLFDLIGLFYLKYHYKILKKKLFTRTKHNLIIGKDKAKKRGQVVLIKNLD